MLLAVVILLAGCGAVTMGPPTPEGTVLATMTPTTQSADTPTGTPTAARTPTPRTPTITPIKLPSSIADICLQRATFGDPAASPYILPYPVGKSYLVSQSYCNRRGSHANQLAYDFNIPIGEDILASRAGTVVLFWDEASDDGYGVENNYLFIRHTDGTVAMYAHLKRYGIDVEVGDYVEQGQRIATSGNSGTGGTPHLHFGVYASWPNLEGFDIPVNFSNAEGPLDTRGGLESGQEYEALPFNDGS
jgi:murein DD-endopeptidase MepM/ murein hydrolase activator NlpD